MVLPEKWHNWHIEDILGEGSFGRVYEIEQDVTLETAALKVIPCADEESARKELLAMEELSECKHIMPVLDSACCGGQLYIMMPLMESLVDYQSIHLMDEESVIRMGIDLCNALSFCEDRGILHRDIKPDNIMIDDEGNFVLSDFGFAMNLEDQDLVKGTEGYMPPEVHQKKVYGPSSDLYSLGLVMYQMVNRNRAPFIPLDGNIISAADQEKAFGRRISGARLPLPVDASPELSRILLKACHPRPENRYRSAKALKKDLKDCLTGEYNYLSPVTIARRAALALLAVALILYGGICLSGYSNVTQLIRQITDGDPVTYKLNWKGTLRIGNTGKVSNISDWGVNRNKIRKIVLEEGIVEINDNAFKDCPSLEEVDFPSSLRRIGREAFAGCGKLKLNPGSLPAQMEMIGLDVMKGTAWEKNQGDYILINGFLTGYRGDSKDIAVPEGCRVISSRLFYGDSGIKALTLPASITEIGDLAFSHCSSLSDVTFKKTPEKLGSLVFTNTPWAKKQGDYLIIGKTLVLYSGNSSKVTIPENVISIGPEAFADHHEIRTVIIPDAVEIIDSTAFIGCIGIEDIDIKGFAEEDLTEIFADTPWMAQYIGE